MLGDEDAAIRNVVRLQEDVGLHVVTDDGRASCNGKPLVDITSAQLITAPWENPPITTRSIVPENSNGGW